MSDGDNCRHCTSAQVKRLVLWHGHWHAVCAWASPTKEKDNCTHAVMEHALRECVVSIMVISDFHVSDTA